MSVCGYSELQSHVDIRDGVRQHTAGVRPGMDRPVRHGEGVIRYDRKSSRNVQISALGQGMGPL